uniref:hypothetical protein n=1 Tax=Trichocoleus desertorum TaxID=1481672 RepID=UPI0025B411B4|nr:hypothetical protein [Trichocoleus desertorum]
MERTLYVVLSFLLPWPPLVGGELFSYRDDEFSAQVLGDSQGRLIVRVVTEAQTCLKTFQPIEIRGFGQALLYLGWSNGSLLFSLNNIELIEDCLGVTPFVLTTNDINFSPIPSAILPPLHTIQTSDEQELFFLETLRDIESKFLERKRYGLIRSAGLLRQLLLDSNALAHVVNQKYRLPIRFRVMDYRTPPPGNPTMHWQSLDPTLYPKSPTIDINLDTFLKAPCLKMTSSQASVRDVIRACANAMGGVHMGTARTAQEKVVVDMEDVISIMGEGPTISALSNLCRISLRAMLPFVNAIHNAA